MVSVKVSCIGYASLCTYRVYFSQMQILRLNSEFGVSCFLAWAVIDEVKAEHPIFCANISDKQKQWHRIEFNVQRKTEQGV